MAFVSVVKIIIQWHWVLEESLKLLIEESKPQTLARFLLECWNYKCINILFSSVSLDEKQLYEFKGLDKCWHLFFSKNSNDGSSQLNTLVLYICQHNGVLYGKSLISESHSIFPCFASFHHHFSSFLLCWGSLIG